EVSSGALKLVDGARREIQRQAGQKAHGLQAGKAGQSNRATVRFEALHDAHGLEEIEDIAFLEEPIFEGAFARSPRLRTGGADFGHGSSRFAARGGHFLKCPSACLVLAVNCVNEFTEAYMLRKRSSTQANKNRPTPTKLRSSNSKVTAVPRQK